MIRLAFLLAALSGCAGYAFTLPSDCSARYLLDYVTTRLPEGTAVCRYAGDGYFNCRYWSHPAAISCACFEERDPPPGQVWVRVT